MPSIALHELSGRVEVQRAGKHEWESVSKGTTFFHNDVVRTLDSTRAVLVWPDDYTTILSSRSQMLISLGTHKNGLSLTRHATLLKGAALFLLRQALPAAIAHSTKIYTPTAVIGIRGTCLAVESDERDGTTTVRVVSGTVFVRNILTPTVRVLAAGYATVVKMGQLPTLPQAYTQNEFRLLAQMFGRNLLKNQAEQQQKKARSDRQKITGSLDRKLALLAVRDLSSVPAQWKMATFAETTCVHLLKKESGELSVFSHTKPGHDPLTTGRETNSRFTLGCEITDLDIVRTARVSTPADSYREELIARAGIRVVLVDVAQSVVLLDRTFFGTVSVPETSGKNTKKAGKATGPGPDMRAPAGRALARAIESAVHEIVSCLRALPDQSTQKEGFHEKSHSK